MTVTVETKGERPLGESHHLHNPSFGHFAASYLSLVALVEGAVFAQHLNALGQQIELGDILHIPPMLFAVVLWHKYASHHQVVGWQTTPWDALIAFAFGGLQLAPSLHIWTDTNLLDKARRFFWLMAAQLLLGVFAYGHAGAQWTCAATQSAVLSRFPDDSAPRKDVRRLYNAMVGFEAQSGARTCLLLCFTLLQLAATDTVACRFGEQWAERTALLGTGLLSVALFVFLFRPDVGALLASVEVEKIARARGRKVDRLMRTRAHCRALRFAMISVCTARIGRIC